MASLTLTARPKTIYFIGEIAPGWFIRQPLQATIERDEAGEYVISDNELAVYGVGADRESAMADYVESLIEYYELIEEESRTHQSTVPLFRHVERFVIRHNG
jgi:hypothetical protein